MTEETKIADELEAELLDEDTELPPPEEENEANIVNVTNILGIIIGAILVIFFIVYIALNIKGKSKKTTEPAELDKAGTKTVIEFKEKAPVDYSSGNSDEQAQSVEKSEEQITEAIDSLPPGLQLPVQNEAGKAPVSSVGSSGKTSKSDRPDTKNSKSPRKIEGLAGLDFSGQTSGQNFVNQVMSGNYGTNSYGQKMSKEEFIAQQMSQTQNLQNQLYGTSGVYGNNGVSTGAMVSTGSRISTGSISDGTKESFFNSMNGSGGDGTFLSKTSLWDGTIISGALVTAINTDNPGVVIARVTENVYSSQDHSYLLIPEGSLLMATYNSSVSYGQNKVQVAWNLLIRPDNYRIKLGNMNGVSAQGSSGYDGSVSNHPFETMKALGMVAIYSILQTEITADINSENNEYLKNSLTDVYAEASKLGNKIVDKALDIKPTIKIKEGTEIKLITNIPLELPPVEVNRATEKYVRTRR